MSDFQKFLDQALKKVDIEPVEDTHKQDDYDIFEEIRTQVVEIRTDLDLTQKELALKSGLTQANISKIEKGISHPTIDTLLKIADGLEKRLRIRFDDFEGD
ncbi:MAG: helix-turn-helix domain-containing protein [Clostridiales bacterium]|nr:helix-turn-helix domain-containing protein [Clostridiales bacterium]